MGGVVLSGEASGSAAGVGGASGDNDFADAARTAVVKKGAGAGTRGAAVAVALCPLSGERWSLALSSAGRMLP